MVKRSDNGNGNVSFSLFFEKINSRTSATIQISIY